MVLPVPPLPLATATIIVLPGWLPGAISTWPLLNRSTAWRTVSPSRFCPTLMPAAVRA